METQTASPIGVTASSDPKVEKRVRVRDLVGRTVVARLYGPVGPKAHVLLPDGQLGIPDELVFTDDPFVALSPEQTAEQLVAPAGPFPEFHVLRTEHYVLVYRSTESYARESGQVLENLFKALTEAFEKRDVPVHAPEFPLVAVIFETEHDFRSHRNVAPEIQAYYELYSNRILFYEKSDRDENAPEVAAVRRPQTVAHEGTHQLLQNIGVQPRLADWPPWLVEGLAEYCATPLVSKKATTWEHLGAVNAQHLATIRDMADPASGQVPGAVRPDHIGRPRELPLVEYLVTKPELSPTDYALSWALTHYLAIRRPDDFVAFLAAMSQMPPLVRQTPADHIQAFHAAFGDHLDRLSHDVDLYLGKLKIKVKDPLPFYAVMFQQRVPDGQVKRAAIVSQSPSLIRQWLETVTSPGGDPPAWEAIPRPSRNQAYFSAERWMRDF